MQTFGPKILIPDLRICTVKSDCQEAVDRMFVFEIVTPTKSFILQATSSSEKEQWLTAITVSAHRHAYVGETEDECVCVCVCRGGCRRWRDVDEEATLRQTVILCHPVVGLPRACADLSWGQNAVGAALDKSTSKQSASQSTSSLKSCQASILTQSGNSFCADCGAAGTPMSLECKRLAPLAIPLADESGRPTNY